MGRMFLSCTTCSLRGRGRDEIAATLHWGPRAGFKQWGLAGPFTWEPGLIQWLDVEKLKQQLAGVGLVNLTEIWSPPIPTSSMEEALLGAEHVALVADDP